MPVPGQVQSTAPRGGGLRRYHWLLQLCLTSLLIGCGIGSGGSDSSSGSGSDAGGGAPANQLVIELSGQTKYRADDAFPSVYPQRDT